MNYEEKLTTKESYEVMLDFLRSWYELTENPDITDILSGALYYKIDEPIDSAFWEYWLESIERVKNNKNNPFNELKDV